MLTEKSVTGASAWARLFEELTVGDRGRRSGRRRRSTLDVALAASPAPTASCAATTAEAVTAALEPGLRTRAFVFNTLLADKATDDRLRSYPNWLAARNLANEASDESVQALIDAVQRPLRARAPLVSR